MNYRLLESISTTTLLGIRFWDPVLDHPITDGLKVTLYSPDNLAKVNIASRTASGNFAFHHINGMRDFEQGAELGSPGEALEYILQVQDQRLRYSDVAMSVDLPLPYRGLFLVGDSSGSPSTAPKGFNLYSTTTRSTSPEFANIRGTLINSNTDSPANSAVVTITNEYGFSWYGIANSNGEFVVLMSYPVVGSGWGESPPVSDGTRLFERTWPVTVSVQYEPEFLITLPGSDQFHYPDILSQTPATLLPDSRLGPGQATIDTEITFGRDLFLRTTGVSELFISPA